MSGGIEELRACVRAGDVLRVLPTLTDAPLHLVGGAVRDALRGGTTHADWDIAVKTGAPALAQRFAAAIGGSYVTLDEVRATARVIRGTTQYDFVDYREPTLNADLRARDLTVNAIAVDLRALVAGGDTSPVDPCGGMHDLETRTLRPCGPGVFAADPLRMVRLYRFVATLGFTVAPAAERQAQAVRARDGGAWWWQSVAPERVTDELARLFTAPYAGEGITGIAHAGMLEAFVPHIAATHGLLQGANHHLDVFAHDLAASVAVAGEFLPTLGTWARPHAEALHQWLRLPTAGGRRRHWLVPFACLLHDIGKARTQETRPDGTPRFPRHEVAGGRIAAQVAANLRLSRVERGLLIALVRYHGYPNTLQRYVRDQSWRFFAVAGDAAPGVILVAMGDRDTARGNARTPMQVARDVAFLQGLMREFFGAYTALIATPPLVRGDALSAHLGFSPGKHTGELLLLLRRRQLEGTITHASDALSAAETLMALRHPVRYEPRR